MYPQRFIPPNYFIPYTTFKPSIISRFTKVISSFNWKNLLEGTSKTLNTINQTIPLIKNIKPMIDNVKSIIRLTKAFGKETTTKTIYQHKDKVLNNSPPYESSNLNEPTFFI